MIKISLYECSNAIVSVEDIHCRKGHRLEERRGDGTISIQRLIRGVPLEMTVCQGCKDFDRNGPRVKPRYRGWIKLKGEENC